jgi:transposase-like protein
MVFVMKKQHANAALTIPQRLEVKRLFDKEKVSVSDLAKRFCCGESTIRKWINRASPQDQSSAPHCKRVVVTQDYRQAVLAYRQQHPTHGPIRIAAELQAAHPQAHRGTVALILQKAGLTQPRQRAKPKWQIPVGKHRLQCDVQQLPAIRGSQGFEYKISFIHLRTRWKYSEIHPNQWSETIAGVYQRALDNLPPFS